MTRRRKEDDSRPRREARAPLPPRDEAPKPSLDESGMTHSSLIEALRAIEGLVDVGRDPPNFQFCSRPFLHFHEQDGRVYADVRFGRDFEPVWASTPGERSELFSRVAEHVERVASTRKAKRRPRRA
ncbi:MAG TPA: hypothetical protein VFQ35_14570 [Polyangiaceae bacterium]|nr:hypothetical protein [Polyangiaceae bacterium]